MHSASAKIDGEPYALRGARTVRGEALGNLLSIAEQGALRLLHTDANSVRTGGQHMSRLFMKQKVFSLKDRFTIKIVTCIRVVKITYFRQIVPCIVAIWDFQKPNLSISPLSPSNQMVD